MEVVYAPNLPPNKITKSIFLAGPSPRNGIGHNWRKDALDILSDLNFDGVVFVPLTEAGDWPEFHGYEGQIEWETRYLNMADLIVFWIPRDLETLPGFTTNIEWGMWFDSGKALLGSPSQTPKMRYLEYQARKTNVPTFNNLSDILKSAVKKLGDGVSRSGGEALVPLHIWNTPQFMNWYISQSRSGNIIHNARVLWTHYVKGEVFAFALWVNMYVEAEGRFKDNEFIISRPDISVVVAHYYNSITCETEVVLIRDFRSPVRNKSGFILELPGGSSHDPNSDMLETAAKEFGEETGLKISMYRLMFQESRQVFGTFLTHKIHVFSLILSEEEIEFLRNQTDPQGNSEDSELTKVFVHKLSDLVRKPPAGLDWSTLGIILSTIGH